MKLYTEATCGDGFRNFACVFPGLECEYDNICESPPDLIPIPISCPMTQVLYTPI